MLGGAFYGQGLCRRDTRRRCMSVIEEIEAAAERVLAAMSKGIPPFPPDIVALRLVESRFWPAIKELEKDAGRYRDLVYRIEVADWFAGFSVVKDTFGI